MYIQRTHRSAAAAAAKIHIPYKYSRGQHTHTTMNIDVYKQLATYSNHVCNGTKYTACLYRNNCSIWNVFCFVAQPQRPPTPVQLFACAFHHHILMHFKYMCISCVCVYVCMYYVQCAHHEDSFADCYYCTRAPRAALLAKAFYYSKLFSIQFLFQFPHPTSLL